MLLEIHISESEYDILVKKTVPNCFKRFFAKLVSVETKNEYITNKLLSNYKGKIKNIIQNKLYENNIQLKIGEIECKGGNNIYINIEISWKNILIKISD